MQDMLLALGSVKLILFLLVKFYLSYCLVNSRVFAFSLGATPNYLHLVNAGFNIQSKI